MGCEGPITFEVNYREASKSTPLSYFVGITLDKRGRPVVESESLRRSISPSRGDHIDLLRLRHGKGFAFDTRATWVDDPEPVQNEVQIDLSDPQRLAVSVLGSMTEHPRIRRLHDFLGDWFLSYFQVAAARELPLAESERHLSTTGENMANVVQYMEREHPGLLKGVLKRIASKIPGIQSIETHTTEDRRVLLRFNECAFQDPFYAQQMSDGTLKIFAYLLLLEDPEPPSLLCIEEPENGLHHKLLEALATEFRAYATGGKNSSQIFVTTHQPYFVNALTPEEVWVLEKGADGFSGLLHVAEMELVKNLVGEGLPLGGLWYSDYLDAR
jgi:predicted ATPase